MSKAAKQWRGAVIRLFTRLEDLWAGVGGSCGRSLAGDTGVLCTGFKTMRLQAAESPAKLWPLLRERPRRAVASFWWPPSPRLGRMPLTEDAEPAQVCQPAGRLLRVRAGRTCLLFVRRPGRQSFAG